MSTQPGDAQARTAMRSALPKPGSTSSAALMGSARELVILHAEEEYRLRITSKGKLILTK